MSTSLHTSPLRSFVLPAILEAWTEEQSFIPRSAAAQPMLQRADPA